MRQMLNSDHNYALRSVLLTQTTSQELRPNQEYELNGPVDQFRVEEWGEMQWPEHLADLHKQNTLFGEWAPEHIQPIPTY